MVRLNKHEAALIVFFLAVALPFTAHGYIDPGTGSYLVQILIAVFAGGAVVVRTFWASIKSIFSKPKKEDVAHQGVKDEQEGKPL